MTTYTDNPLDKALASATPVYAAAHDTSLPTLAEGQHCYLLAGNGLFVLGQGRGFHALVHAAALPRSTGFADLSPGVTFSDGLVPCDLVRSAGLRAIEHSPTEWAGAIVRIGGQWSLQAVGVSSDSPSHVTYDRTSYDDADVVVDMHSHGADGAYFSPTDNASDAEGIHLSAVFGRCSSRQALELVCRVTINGFFHKLSADQWLTAATEAHQ